MSRSLRQVLSRLEHLEVLYKVSNIINTTLEPREILRLLLQEVVRITNATSGSVAMIDHKRGILNIETAINLPPKAWRSCKLELGVGVTGYAAWTGKPVRVGDVTREPLYVRLKSDIRSEMALPMVLDGKVIGVINVDSTRAEAFSEEDEELGQAVANQSAKVIETARLHDAVKRHAEEMDRLFTVGSTLIRPGPLEHVLERIVGEGLALLGGKVCVLMELEEGGMLHTRAIAGASPVWRDKAPVSVGDSLVGTVVNKKTPIRVPDVHKSPRFRYADLAREEGLVSLLAAPVIFQEKVLAVIGLYAGEPRRFKDAEVKLLQLLANQGAIAIENARRMERLTALEESLRQAERLSVLGTLAAEIAHEIRNPITIINLVMHSIRENADHTDQTRDDLRIVTEKLDRINHIIEQTLNLARSGETKLQPICLNAVVEELLMFLSFKLTKGNIAVKTVLEPKLPSVDADRGQMQQVLLNLMVNAIEAMNGGGTLTVRTRAASDRKLGRCVRCSITDDGAGIPADVQTMLFQPFHTTRENGTGLGLFISNKLVRRHNGTLRFKNARGRGATFTVSLPIRDAAEDGQ